MPVKKKKGKGKKKGKKSGKKSSKSSDSPKPVDPLTPEIVQPFLKIGESLVNLLKTQEVGDKEVHGWKVSGKVLKELTPQDIRDLRIVFEVFDSNSDGKINHVELRRSLKALGFTVSKAEAREMIEDGVVGKSRHADFNDFLEFVIDKQGDARDAHDEILKGFKMFDYDRTGKITIDNLRLACKEAGVTFSEKELEDMIDEGDTNGDGKIDQEEFIRLMLQTNLF